MDELTPEGIELIYIDNDHYQTTEKMPSNLPSWSDYWKCYIPRVVTKKLGLVPKVRELYVLTLRTKAQLAKVRDRPELEQDIKTTLKELFNEYGTKVNIPLGLESPDREMYVIPIWVSHIIALFNEEEIRKQERWNVGEELCCIIGNKMLEDMDAGILLGNQLQDYMNQSLKVGGSRQIRKGEEDGEGLADTRGNNQARD